MKEEINLSPIDKSIINVLRKENKPLTTYKIAKKSKISWSAVNLHCYKLKSQGVLDFKVYTSPYGQKKVVWELEERKLERFT